MGLGSRPEAPPRHEGSQVGADLGHFEAGYRGDQVLCVGAYVADGPGHARLLGICTPLGLLGAALLDEGTNALLIVVPRPPLVELEHRHLDRHGVRATERDVTLRDADVAASLGVDPKTVTTGNVLSAETITYLDVGLKLEVEPTVYLDDEVGIKVALEVNSNLERITGPDG